MNLYLVNAVAAFFALAGFHLAFRQKLVRTWGARLRNRSSPAERRGQAQAASLDGQEIASVLRMAGIMTMAFSFTAAAFANLMAYYTSSGPS